MEIDRQVSGQWQPIGQVTRPRYRWWIVFDGASTKARRKSRPRRLEDKIQVTLVDSRNSGVHGPAAHVGKEKVQANYQHQVASEQHRMQN